MSNNDPFADGYSEWYCLSNFYMIKHKFMENGFSICVSNLIEFYKSPEFDEKKIQDKFSGCNRHAEMKTKIILKNLKQCFEDKLSNKESNIEIEEFGRQNLNMTLQFKVNNVNFIFRIDLYLDEVDDLHERQVMVPLLTHALLSHQENLILKKKIHDLSNSSSAMSPQNSLSDYKPNTFVSNLIGRDEKEVHLIDLIKAFIEIQKNMKDCHEDRKKIFGFYRKQLPASSNGLIPTNSNTPIKREISEVLEPSEIKYEDGPSVVANEPDFKQEIKEENKMDESSVEQSKAKKKKTLKF